MSLVILSILGALVAGLVVLYLVSPPVRRRRISAARFLLPLPNPPRPLGGQIRLRRLITSPPFWLQLIALALLCAAVWAAAMHVPLRGPRSIGLQVMIDTSASMSTIQGGVPRIELARLKASEAIVGSFAAAEGLAWCAQISSFDAEVRDLAGFGDPIPAAGQLPEVEVRPLGTNLDLLRGRLSATDPVAPAAANSPEPDCPITDLVVISDRPAPPWLADLPTPVKWQDISQPVASVGFANIQPVHNRLTGAVVELRYEVVAYGPQPAPSTLTISGPDGVIRDEVINWTDRRVLQDRFRPTTPGDYTLTLSSDGAYNYDDRAQITIPGAATVALDWRLADRSVPDQLGWVTTTSNPIVQVIGYEAIGSLSSQIPTLIIGPGYAATEQPGEQLIRYFDERSLLLADLNLDVAERAGIRGAPALPDRFDPVLSGSDGTTWIAVRQPSAGLSPPTPAAVFIPGLPLWSDENLGAFSQTVFFNALRFLLNERELPQIYTLTSPAAPKPEGNRLALHPGEGDTGGVPLSIGDLDRWEPAGPGVEQGSLWPLLAALAAGVLLFERLALIIWGHRWN